MSFLQLRGITKTYGKLTVVSDIDLSIEQGEFVSLLGPSGCGKTTTLQMIAGFAEVTKGTIMLAGKDITHMAPSRRGLGIVFQTYALFPHMTVAQNVAFGLEMRKVPKGETAQRVDEALALVKLHEHAQRYPRELSGGQRQRVALARALVIRPSVLLLDEPLSNLDAKLREDMQFEIRSIQRHLGITTIMVTHDQAEAMSISDRVVVMENGRITQVGAPYRLYEYPRSEFISKFVGKANVLDGRVEALNGAGAFVSVGPLKFHFATAGHKVGAEVRVCLRPEKIALAPREAGRLSGTVNARFFLGSQWLFTIDTSIGTLNVVQPNNGAAMPAEGDVVGLLWADEQLRLVGDDACAATAQPAEAVA